jgi:hypothetical protein
MSVPQARKPSAWGNEGSVSILFVRLGSPALFRRIQTTEHPGHFPSSVNVNPTGDSSGQPSHILFLGRLRAEGCFPPISCRHGAVAEKTTGCFPPHRGTSTAMVSKLPKSRRLRKCDRGHTVSHAGSTCQEKTIQKFDPKRITWATPVARVTMRLERILTEDPRKRSVSGRRNGWSISSLSRARTDRRERCFPFR